MNLLFLRHSLYQLMLGDILVAKRRDHMTLQRAVRGESGRQVTAQRTAARRVLLWSVARLVRCDERAALRVLAKLSYSQGYRQIDLCSAGDVYKWRRKKCLMSPHKSCRRRKFTKLLLDQCSQKHHRTWELGGPHTQPISLFSLLEYVTHYTLICRRRLSASNSY